MVPSELAVFLWTLLPVVTGFQVSDEDGLLCVFSTSLQGAEPAQADELRGAVQENGTIRCSRGSRCYGLWEKKADSEMQLLNQGCWNHVGADQECGGDRCVFLPLSPGQLWKVNYRFCCCAHALCNANITEAPTLASPPALRHVGPRGHRDPRTGRQLTPEETALVALVTVVIAAVVVVGLFLGYSMMKRKYKQSLSAVEVLESGQTESSVDLDQLKLLELIGRGRYGAVFRGSLNERRVAVKLFNSANRQNFSNECSIYALPLLRQHENIARFLVADERTASDGRPEFLILMEFYPHGCLSHYLSSHTVDWFTCCKMTYGVTRGLAFLHTELHRGDQYKPAVAHRDLTSRNVLVRADLSCVLADFGLSMKLTETWPCRTGDDDTVAISEVGTVRYMAPEVLGGALNLRDCEAALKQVDVYALGLMYWESFRRCLDLFPGEPVPEYQLVFQAELGNHPSFEEMQTLVVREKFRPRFPEAWKENSLAIHSLKETMEDCWDQDAEARLTAQCAEERLLDLALMTTHTAGQTHRNLSQGPGSASLIENFQVGMVRNLQGDASPPAVIRTGSDVPEKNWNHERQQSRSPRSSNGTTGTTRPLQPLPPSTICTVSECQHTGGAVPVPACLHLTEEDLEATKMEAAEVEKNLREKSNQDLTELSQKCFTSEPQPEDWLCTPPAILSGADGPLHPPKQQNQAQRPTSLHLLPKTGRRQVQTGVAKMNAVTTVLVAEPHLVTTVTNSAISFGKEVQSSSNSGAPIMVKNQALGGGRSNPAGPREEEEEEEAKGGTGDGCFNLLNFSPDEHEPLLRSEQPPPGTKNRGPNSNNNNSNGLNRPVTDRVHHTALSAPSPDPGPGSNSGPRHWEAVEMNTGPNPTGQLVLDSCSSKIKEDATASSETKTSSPSQIPAPGPDPEPLGAESPSSDPEVLDPEYPSSDQECTASDTKPPDPEASDPEPPAPDPPASDPDGPTSKPPASGAASDGPHSEPLIPALLQTWEDLVPVLKPEHPQDPVPVRRSERPKDLVPVQRPERPRSLDLSSFCSSSDCGSLSDAGEKIKRRVKTPYTLKKWRPASWLASGEGILDPEFLFTSGPPRTPRSSRGGGVSQPDGMTSF